MPYVKISQKDNGEKFALYLGETAEISLSENPTTGYIWEEESSDSNILQVTSSFIKPSKKKQELGQGGIRKIVVTPKKLGTAQVTAYLKRTWEPDEVAHQQFVVTLVVMTR